MPSPAENLALDEALLVDAEAGAGGEVLRFWMSPASFIVLGVGARVREEVAWDACLQQGIPVLRRCSGGGTVLQGPGCLSYALVLRNRPQTPTAAITTANRFIMEQNARALSSVLGLPVAVEGYTDLAVDGRKVSGNSQRRLRHHLLFHGTVMLSLDPALMSQVLKLPSRQPDYRANRPHESFVTNINLGMQCVKDALSAVWQADGALPTEDLNRLHARTRQLVSERYGRDGWNLRS